MNFHLLKIIYVFCLEVKKNILKNPVFLLSIQIMGSKGSKRKFCLKHDPTELTDEEIQFLLKTTKYNYDEIRMWHTGFIVSLSEFFEIKI